MRSFRTDLAMEAAGRYQKDIQGVSVQTVEEPDISRTTVRIDTEDAARKLGKTRGTFISFCASELPRAGAEMRMKIATRIGEALTNLLPPSDEVLVIGLGNRHVTADALGAEVVDYTLVTRHMRGTVPEDLKARLRSVCAVAPGVLGVTGMETAEMVKGIVERVRPCAVIAIDALAALDTARIGTTVQITDTGINPGSGVGNHRRALTFETLGVPVIAIGVPMVVYAATIARDALTMLVNDLHLPDSEEVEGERALDALIEHVSAGALGELVVTPREIDNMVKNLAQTLAMGINFALQPHLSKDEIPILMN